MAENPFPQNLCQAVRESCASWMKNIQSYQLGQDDESNPLRRQPLVRINESRLRELSSEMMRLARDQNKKRQGSLSTENLVEWDEEGWHYDPPQHWPLALRRERIAMYIMALDSINFCFWPSTTDIVEIDAASPKEHEPKDSPYEYDDLAITLSNIASSDHETMSEALAVILAKADQKVDIGLEEKLLSLSSSTFLLSPTNLARITDAEMSELFSRYGTSPSAEGISGQKVPTVAGGRTSKIPPNITARCRLWNEVGAVLIDNFSSSCWTFIDKAKWTDLQNIASDNPGTSQRQLSAVQLVDAVVHWFPGFRDVDQFDIDNSTVPIYFLKRAQILVSDWNAALRLDLEDIDKLTMFADYRVPQFLAYKECLQYREDLQATISQGTEIDKGSMEEISIRAATVTAVEMLVDFLNSEERCYEGYAVSSDIDGHDRAHSGKWTAVQTDWYLWQIGEKLQKESRSQRSSGSLVEKLFPPHHKTRTTNY
jgi:Potential Queuosine, Q, salvage protein family